MGRAIGGRGGRRFCFLMLYNVNIHLHQERVAFLTRGAYLDIAV